MSNGSFPENVAAEFALTNRTVPHGSSVLFFNGLPRWSGIVPDLKFDSLTSYALEISFSAVIPIIAFLVVLILSFTLLTVRNSCLSAKLDQKLVNRRRKSSKSKIGHLVASTLVIHSFCFFLGIGILGAVVLAESSLNVSSSLSSFVGEVQKTGLSLIDFIQWMKNRFVAFDPSTLNEDDTVAGQFLETAFGTLVKYVPERFPDVSATRAALADLMQDITDLIQVLADYVVWTFTAMVAFMLISALALAFTFTSGMFTHRRTCCTIILHLFLVLVPLLLSWLYFALWTGAGIGFADGCRMIGEYRSLLSTGVLENTTTNILMDSGLVCPSKEDANKLQEEMNAAADSIVQNPLAADTMTLLLGTKGNELSDSATWAVAEVSEYVNCNILVRLSGRLESVMCGARLTSLVSGIRYLWISSLMLSVMMTTLFCLSVLEYPVMWASAVWALPQMDPTFLDALESEVESGDHDQDGESFGDEENLYAVENDDIDDDDCEKSKLLL